MFILYNKPNKASCDNFINKIFEERKVYYRANYFFINYENDKDTELNKMQWLLKEEVITENEYNVVHDEIIKNL